MITSRIRSRIEYVILIPLNAGATAFIVGSVRRRRNCWSIRSFRRREKRLTWRNWLTDSSDGRTTESLTTLTVTTTMTCQCSFLWTCF